jgi:thiamine pyrophosphate-dependent acetolactate synthase large subunit-like protein
MNGQKIGVSADGGLSTASTRYLRRPRPGIRGLSLLCLTDGVPNEATARERFNIEDRFRSVTKWSGYINQGRRVPEFVRRAYTQLRCGHPSPVILQVPRGLEEYDTDEHPYTPVKGWKPAGDPTDVRRPSGLPPYQNPMIYAGQGLQRRLRRARSSPN